MYKNALTVNILKGTCAVSELLVLYILYFNKAINRNPDELYLRICTGKTTS